MSEGTPQFLIRLPMEVFSLVMSHLFDNITIRVDTPSELSRINRAAKEEHQLAILQLLRGDLHDIAKSKLLKGAFFEFARPFNPAHPFSSWFKYLDRLCKLSVEYDKLWQSTIGELEGPYKYVGTLQKRFTPYEIAEMYTRRKSLRVLKVKKHFRLAPININNPLAHLRHRVATELTAEISKAGPGVRDILRLGRTKISERCDVVLELSFKNDNDDRIICKASIVQGKILKLECMSEQDTLEVSGELNEWYKPSSLK